MSKNKKTQHRIFKTPIPLPVLPSAKDKNINNELQIAILSNKKVRAHTVNENKDKSKDKRKERIQTILRFFAFSAVLGASGYGLYKAAPHIQNKWEGYKYNQFINAVVPEERSTANDLYSNKNQNVKMIRYEVIESEKENSSWYSSRDVLLVMNYDANNDGKADYCVEHIVDGDLFYSYGEGDVANETHGSWKNYAHPLNDVLNETRLAKGRIIKLSNHKVVDFSRERE